MKARIMAKFGSSEVTDNAEYLLTALTLTVILASLLVFGSAKFNVMNPALTSGVVSQQVK